MISVILPTYNESENIRIIVPRIMDVLKGFELEGEVVIVDDNSPDGTGEVAAQLAGNYPVNLCVRKSERGLATAVIKGFSLASGDIFVVMDADLSHPVEKIPDMVKPILEGKCDATVGSRYIEGGGCRSWSFMRRFISRFSGFLAFGLSRLSDPTSGFMAIKKEALNGIKLDPVGWKIVIETVVKTGVKVIEVPIIFSDRLKGKSKLDVRAQTQYVAHLWKLYCFRYPSVSEFFKFCIVGLLGIFIDTAVLIGFVEIAHFDPRLAAVFSFIAAVSFNYLLNRLWTFKGAEGTGIITSYTLFVTVCITGLLIRLGVMHVLIEFFNMGVGYRYVLASIIGIFTATIFNFLGTKFIAFSPASRVKQLPYTKS